MYATPEQFKAYASARGLQTPQDDSKISELLTLANDWLQFQEWRGKKSDPVQAPAWPRTGVIVDGVELPSDQVPVIVVDAECQLAAEYMTTDLMATISGHRVVRERVEGVVDVEYAKPVAGELEQSPVPVKVLAMLKPLLESGGGIGEGGQFRVFRG